ncbi:hypothetical protein J2Z35_002194 [Acetoanaerobium pronyense]|uniref:HNH nuclease domain-containing protein n=1 Tax=Acetoanaerobium pronyense TaxID=1482736 RepID=A0ABS4KKT3_9FIRM|nr:HNH endonuclease signature motif containing protein [Acetoanaerobium pronyense]MBP2028393.1 hypothetical protein [Acetoanaerobium pronyense]
MKRSIKTKHQEIVDYWFSRVDECGLSVDAAEAHERCWRCGYESRLERCHIIPYSLGGTDLPSNLVLLCPRCHIENPNVTDPEIMWDWIRSYGTPFYDTFWMLQAFKEYEFIYGRSFEEELKIYKIEDIYKFEKLFREEIKKTAYHYGHPYLNSATMAGVIRIVLKKIQASS